MSKKNVFIGLGANLGDRVVAFNNAINLISREIGQIVKLSGFHETLPLKTNSLQVSNQPNYLNAVIWVESELPPSELLKRCMEIERLLGRDRSIEVRWGPRVIDLDILAVDDLIISTAEIKIPHPEIQNRDFVLIPWNEIAPEYVHPVLKLRIKDLLSKKTTSQSPYC